MFYAEFKVNKYLSLKLEDNKTNVYINNQKFIQCKKLLLNYHVNSIHLHELESIDEVLENQEEFLYQPKISSQTEFWGHCSSLQLWVEQNYNTKLLHSNIAFPLLRKLSEVGDPKAKEVFKDEIIKRILSGYIPTIIFLVTSNYLNMFNQEEFEILIDDIKKCDTILEENTLDLIYSFKDKYLGACDLIFLIEHPKINFFELLIKFGGKILEKDGGYIGESRQWVSDLLNRLNKRKPKYLAEKIRELVRKDIIKVRFHTEKLNIYKKVDYSLMTEFSILLYNHLTLL